jgi:hypothetical protein
MTKEQLKRYQVEFAIEVDRIMENLSKVLDQEYIEFRRRLDAIDRRFQNANDN